MNLFKRILLAIYAFFLTIISAIIMVVPFKLSLLDNIYVYIKDSTSNSLGSKILLLVIGLIFFVLSVTFLFSGFKKNPEKKSIIKSLDKGKLIINLDALESITLTSLNKLRGIKESKAYVYKKDEKIYIKIKIKVYPEVIIPQIAKEIQKTVKKDVESSTEIEVDQIEVNIENVTSYSMLEENE